MSTEPKFDIVPIAQKTQQIASDLWQKRPVRYVIVPGLVIALGVGAVARLRTRPTNTEPPASPDPKSQSDRPAPLGDPLNSSGNGR